MSTSSGTNSLLAALCCGALAIAAGLPAQAQSLLGSRATMERQNLAAVNYGYSFLQTSAQVQKHVEQGHLVKVSAGKHLELHQVSFPYARPQVKLFLDRLSTQYHSACGEILTVTSLTRPINRQPANASQASVHPTGMAVDLRIPPRGKCRSWLENTLLSLEKTGVLDVTRERNPPHYHVAVFTQDYEQYVASMEGGKGAAARPAREYTVRKGDTLSLIARRNGSSIEDLRAANDMRGDLIRVGQTLQIPGSTESPEVQLVAAAADTDAKPVITEITHKVRRGDTLWRIASRYGTNVSDLRAENDLANDLLQIGQVLRLTRIQDTP